VVATTQHREMLKQALDVFGITPDVDLGLMQNGQNSASSPRGRCKRSRSVFSSGSPTSLVQGDTSTVTAAALAAFYQGIPIGHIEGTALIRSEQSVSRRGQSTHRHVHGQHPLRANTGSAQESRLRGHSGMRYLRHG
jgi:UDP-N-acetylglucosamine 2-epimerase (non-hydrolysing)